MSEVALHGRVGALTLSRLLEAHSLARLERLREIEAQEGIVAFR